ncbi:Lead, cadmium, zinc and mercury transporting ATPase [Labilithrix luteola]|uniref:Lead, cadmium, zinc and mercury transporting ATPase n=1 Tax=Labilithrix luteola TaxID=1391654 RepID=A0A0K1PN47_9BACT|nr:heavy metal-associated domain-containing protein [Labilithrix luteola]AKU94953.1 Lead, cadmium, zinc and mercury transporting ATPase [Labilithrix luteola]
MTNKKETILDVDGMTCSSCIRHVEAALREVDGVDKIEVKIRDGKVRVEHDASRATLDQMIRALGDAGYESRAAGA